MRQRPEGGLLEKGRKMLRLLGVAVLALALPLAAFAAAVAESSRGDVRAGDEPVRQGQRLAPQTAITTGPGGQVFLRFDDGMQIVLHENSLLRMIDFHHTPSGVTDRAVFELLRGAARVVTGQVAVNNPKQFFFRTPQTQLTVERGADFTVALVNPAYLRVNSGTVLSSNLQGTLPLNAGTTSVIASSGAAPAAIAPSSLPASASSAMGNLALASVTPPAGGAATGVGTVAGGSGAASLVLPAALLLGVGVTAAALGGDDTPSQATTPSHH